MPRVSVVLNARDAERHIAETLDSLLAQTYSDFELICVDDGSSDSTPQIMHEYAARDPRVRVMVLPKTGISGAINRAIAECSGEYIAHTDADDISLPQRLARQVQYMDDHPECVALGSRVLCTDPDLRPLIVKPDQLTHEDIDAKLLTGVCQALYHPAMMFRAETLRKIGGYDETFAIAPDLDLFLRLAEVGKLANLDEVLLKYRNHFASIGHARAREQFDSCMRAVALARQRRGLGPAPETPFPLSNIRIPADQHEKWAWWALGSGFVQSARCHAWQAFRSRPHRPHVWRLMACVIRGH
jgi:glycosyltransferase involved in cell wall biosynthesis